MSGSISTVRFGSQFMVIKHDKRWYIDNYHGDVMAYDVVCIYIYIDNKKG